MGGHLEFSIVSYLFHDNDAGKQNTGALKSLVFNDGFIDLLEGGMGADALIFAMSRWQLLYRLLRLVMSGTVFNFGRNKH